MKKEQNITIKIADCAPISMTIARDTEELVREAERNVNQVWSRWHAEFEDSTSKEVLAMVAFQFAKLYFQLRHELEASSDGLDDFERELDRLLNLTLPGAPGCGNAK